MENFGRCLGVQQSRHLLRSNAKIMDFYYLNEMNGGVVGRDERGICKMVNETLMVYDLWLTRCNKIAAIIRIIRRVP